MLYPIMLLEVLAVHDNATLWVAGGTPVPVRDSTVGEFEASLVKNTFPDATPFPAGVKVIVNCTCCPAGMVTGSDNPLKANADPVTLSEDTVTLLPVALRVPVICKLDPTVTLPKF